jgi:hypothetical protein
MSRHDEDIAADLGDWSGFEEEPEPGYGWDEDGHQAYKDDLAAGRIYPDGSPRDPDPPEEYPAGPWHPGPDSPWAYTRPGVLGRLAARLTAGLAAWPRLAAVRIGPVELAVRVRRSGPCGACAARGWFYTKGGLDPVPRPDGYDGVSLCGCGTALTQLAERQRRDRQYRRRSRREPPF